MKRKHSELIKAWADGARIQCLSQPFNEWIDVNHNPSWRDDREYRIKPEPKPDIVKHIHFDADSQLSEIFIGDDLENKHSHWDLHLKVVIDGETGKLKSAEVIK